MLNLVSGRSAELGPDLKLQLARYRHKVFIEGLGWPLPSVDGMDRDQFDHAETVYVIATGESGEVAGCGRLLPTDQPYLLGEVFPTLMGGAPLPRTPDVWELSRFAITTPCCEVLTARQAWENTCSLMAEIVRVAGSYGARRLIAFSVLGNERLLRRMGVNVHRAAPPQMIDGKLTLPFWVEIDQQTRTALGLDSLPGRGINAQRSMQLTPVFNLAACAD